MRKMLFRKGDSVNMFPVFGIACARTLSWASEYWDVITADYLYSELLSVNCFPVNGWCSSWMRTPFAGQLGNFPVDVCRITLPWKFSRDLVVLKIWCWLQNLFHCMSHACIMQHMNNPRTERSLYYFAKLLTLVVITVINCPSFGRSLGLTVVGSHSLWQKS